ncbi:MAG: 3-keto-disaccharide hydrolase [Planctomycetota bacterium]|jgi:hypothetical protein
MWRKTVLSAMVVLASRGAMAADWVDLFDGKTLKGWTVHSGQAKYHVEEEAIVGTAVKGSPNTFLCTDKEYGDFILEFEVKCDPALNSGVQFRSLIAKQEMVFWFRGRKGEPRRRVIPPDRVYGYQVEIARRAAGSSGGIYDEARRGFFLGEEFKDPKAAKALKDNQWNQYRVECRGDSIRTWVNGVPCADFRDSLTARGVIGLQVHGVRSQDFRPYEVRWRKIRVKRLD